MKELASAKRRRRVHRVHVRGMCPFGVGWTSTAHLFSAASLKRLTLRRAASYRHGSTSRIAALP